MLTMHNSSVKSKATCIHDSKFVKSCFEKDVLNLNKLLIKDEQHNIFVYMRGDAMQNLGIHHGDLLIVNSQASDFTGKIVVVKFKQRLLVRRLYRAFGEILLMPANSDYEPIKLTVELKDILLGVVDCVIRKI